MVISRKYASLIMYVLKDLHGQGKGGRTSMGREIEGGVAAMNCIINLFYYLIFSLRLINAIQ